MIFETGGKKGLYTYKGLSYFYRESHVIVGVAGGSSECSQKEWGTKGKNFVQQWKSSSVDDDDLITHFYQNNTPSENCHSQIAILVHTAQKKKQYHLIITWSELDH